MKNTQAFVLTLNVASFVGEACSSTELAGSLCKCPIWVFLLGLTDLEGDRRI